MTNQPVSQPEFFADKTEGSFPDPSLAWPPEAYELAREAKAANALKLEALIRRLQRKTGRRQRDCALFLLRQIASTRRPQVWTDDEIDKVRELALSFSSEAIATKLGRSAEAVRCMCKRKGIRLRELRCDFFSINSLATEMHVRSDEVKYWIAQGWLEATKVKLNKGVSCKITPEALQKCLRVHLDELQKRHVRSSAIIRVFREYCYVPKHTDGEQLLKVREAKREQFAFDLFLEEQG
jgi:hypothetical protein